MNRPTLWALVTMYVFKKLGLEAGIIADRLSYREELPGALPMGIGSVDFRAAYLAAYCSYSKITVSAWPNSYFLFVCAVCVL